MLTKMGMFTDALKEIKTSIVKLFIFEEILNAILIFLVAYILGSLFKLGWAWPLLPSLGYLAFAFYRETKIKPTKLVETKYKDLQEKLSTAAEYASVDNRVVNELKSEVLKNLRKVEEASFLSERKVYTKSIVAVVLCFIILLLSPVSLSFFHATLPDLFPGSAKDVAEANKNYKPGSEKKKGDIPIAIQASKEDIYGQPSVAKLGKEELEVIFRPAGTELGSSNVKPPEELQFNEQYPDEIVPVAAESMEERIPKEQQELVRRYFRSVVESGK